jgi:hypothetical protein
MLYKPLVSLVMAFATASSVAASLTPVRRGGGGAYPPPHLSTIPISQCNTKSVQCCQTFTNADNPIAAALLGALDMIEGSNVGIGLSCVSLEGGTQW